MSTEYRIPPFRVDSEALTLSGDEKIDWGLLAHDVPTEWAQTRGEKVTVAVLDTGASDHVDLPEPAFAVNLVTSSRTAFDRNGHSTHVAGIIGARANETGVVGVAPLCNIGYCKVLGDDGSGSSLWIARGIEAAVKNKADIINMSLGGGYDRNVQDACVDALQEGVFILAAAGNSGYRGRNSIGYPGRLRETICIASYRRDGQISDFSSGGEEVDAAFPGERILSTWPGNQYRILSGTSMATPFGAGVVALMLAATSESPGVAPPLKNNTDLRGLLERYSSDKGPSGKDARWGWGVPNVGDLVPDVGAAPDNEFYF